MNEEDTNFSIRRNCANKPSAGAITARNTKLNMKTTEVALCLFYLL